MTHTYAVLEVPNAIYAAIRALLERANYEHTFQSNRDGEVIDMHGIALQSKGENSNTSINISTLISSKTQEGKIDFSMNGELTQMDLPKAREVVGMLQNAIEAAISDELLYKFLVNKVGMNPYKAALALQDFREMRQGSKDTVYPS